MEMCMLQLIRQKRRAKLMIMQNYQTCMPQLIRQRTITKLMTEISEMYATVDKSKKESKANDNVDMYTVVDKKRRREYNIMHTLTEVFYSNVTNVDDHD